MSGHDRFVVTKGSRFALQAGSGRGRRGPSAIARAGDAIPSLAWPLRFAAPAQLAQPLLDPSEAAP